MKSNDELNKISNNSLVYKNINPRSSYTYTFKNKVETQPKPQFINTKKHNEATKKVSDVSKLLVTFTALVSGSAICLDGIDTIISPQNYVTVEFYETYAYDNGISFFVALENFDETKDVYVILHNDFTERTQKIEKECAEGYFEDLKENMTYTFEIRQGSKTIASKQIVTVNKDYNNYDEYTDPNSYYQDYTDNPDNQNKMEYPQTEQPEEEIKLSDGPQ